MHHTFLHQLTEVALQGILLKELNLLWPGAPLAEGLSLLICNGLLNNVRKTSFLQLWQIVNTKAIFLLLLFLFGTNSKVTPSSLSPKIPQVFNISSNLSQSFTILSLGLTKSSSLQNMNDSSLLFPYIIQHPKISPWYASTLTLVCHILHS